MTTKRISDWIRNNVLGLVAIFIALSGTAYAVDGPLPGQNQVGSDDIINGEVKGGDIGDAEVRAADIAPDSLGGAKLADRSVKNADLSLGASSSNTIADGGIQGVDVKGETLTGTHVDESTLFNDNSLTGADVNESTLSGVPSEPAGPAGGDLTGSYPTPDIAEDAVGSLEIAKSAVDSSELAPNAVSSGNVFDESLTASDLAPGSVASSEIGTDAVTSSKVLNNTLTENDLGIDSVQNSELDVNAVGSLEVQSNSLLSSDIDDADLEGVDSALQLRDEVAGDLEPQHLGGVTGASFASPCDPNEAFFSCGAVTLNLPAAGPVLLQGSGGFVGTASGEDTGTCQISENPGTVAIGGNMTFGQAGSEHNTMARADGFALSGFVGNASAGTHTWSLLCNQTAGDVQVHDPKLSAIFLF